MRLRVNDSALITNEHFVAEVDTISSATMRSV